MLHKVRDSLNIRKLQFVVVIAGLLIAASALYQNSIGSQSNESNTRTFPAHILDASTGPVPGLFLIWGSSNETSTVKNDAWLHGGQIVFNWGDVEPTEGSFPSWTGAGNSLSTQLAAYYAAGKTATIQVNADSFPSWLVNQGNTGSPIVDYCGYRDLSASGNGAKATIPAYWYNADSTGMNPGFKTAMSNMLSSLANAIANSPYKSTVLGIRTGFDLIGTEHYVLGESSDHMVSPLPPECQNWSATIGNEAAGTSLYLNYQDFSAAGVHPMLRTEAANISVGPGKYFAQDGGFSSTSQFLSPSKAWLFLTNADPDQGQNNLANYTPFVKSGQTIGYAEQYNDASLHSDPLSWEWWRDLMDLSRGTSYIATYYHDVSESDLASGFFNVLFFQNFANTYAGTNTTAAEASSPGAWIAFAPTNSPFGGNLGLFMNQTAQSGNITGYNFTGSVPLGSGQPYGRYATGINPGGSVTLSLDSKVQTGGSATINVWYYDTGSGSWSISGGTVNQTVTKASCSSSCWKESSFTSSSIPGNITLSVPANASSGTDFHMVEMVKGGSVPTCSGNPTVSLTAPISGATVSGTSVALATNASVAAHCTLSQVVFSVNSTSIATITHSPYAAVWDSTTVSNGSYTITATASDTSGHSASNSIPITVDNISSNPGGGGGGTGGGGGSGGITSVGSGGSVPITPNTITQVSGTVTLTPTIPISTPGSTDYVVKTVFYLDGTLLATETKAPFSYHLNTTNYLNGTYTLTVKTYYASGIIMVTTQKLVINNPFSLKQLGLLLLHYAIPLTIMVVLVFALIGFLYWWVRFHSPGGMIAVALSKVRTSISNVFHKFPPWKGPGGSTSGPTDIEPYDTGSSHNYNPLDNIPNPNMPTPGEVVGPENPPDTQNRV